MSITSTEKRAMALVLQGVLFFLLVVVCMVVPFLIPVAIIWFISLRRQHARIMEDGRRAEVLEASWRVAR